MANRMKRTLGAALLAAGLVSAIAHAAPSLKVGVRRITETQYRHTIADIFGPEIEISARFEPEKREEGLLALGSAQLSLTSSGFEQYFVLASAIAKQVVGRDGAGHCSSNDCARQFIAKYGEQLFRRPLTEQELAARSAVAASGLELALTSLLVAPEFLFRVETAEADSDHPGQYRLDAYSKAARLSFLLWDTTPDAELLAAARSDAIHTEAGLRQQLARLTSSPRFEQGARAFFADMLQLDGFDNLVKDPQIYPKFNQAVADRGEGADAQDDDRAAGQAEARLPRVVHIQRALSSIVRWLPSTTCRTLSATDWAPYTFAAASERSGILTQVSFLSLFAHPGTSSPTRRGIKIHEIFMCEPTPDPPADVDFSKVQDSTQGTVRGRLLDHMQNTGCTACHRRSDPPGLALEHFDGLGQLRTLENGMPIDVSADLDGTKFTGAAGLAHYLRDDARVPACLVRNVYAYGVGRKADERDEDYLADQTRRLRRRRLSRARSDGADRIELRNSSRSSFQPARALRRRQPPPLLRRLLQEDSDHEPRVSTVARYARHARRRCRLRRRCRCSTMFLNGNGIAFADGAKLPVRFGTYFWGLGLTDTPTGGTRWVPQDRRPGYEITPELQCLEACQGQGLGVLRLPRDRRRPRQPRALERPCLDHVGHCAGVVRRASTVRRSTRASPMRSAARRASRCSTSTRPLSRQAGELFDPHRCQRSRRRKRRRSRSTRGCSARDSRIRTATNWTSRSIDHAAPERAVCRHGSAPGADGRRRQGRPASSSTSTSPRCARWRTSSPCSCRSRRRCEACVLPATPKEGTARRFGRHRQRQHQDDGTTARDGLACNQTRVFNFVHTAGSLGDLPRRREQDLSPDHARRADRRASSATSPKPASSPAWSCRGSAISSPKWMRSSEGDGTLLDNMLIMAFSDTGYAKIHSIENIPMFLAGRRRRPAQGRPARRTRRATRSRACRSRRSSWSARRSASSASAR